MNHDKVRVFAISDIHETDITTLDPSGCDIAVLAGDIQGHMCSHHLKVDFGSRRIAEQIAWVNGTFLPWCAKYKDVQFVVVAGNNDEFALSPQNPLRHLPEGSNVHYLQDSGIEIKGVKFWGSPWTKPKNHRRHCPADQLKMFERTADDFRKALMKMPEDVDLLVAHATPEVPGSHVAGIPEHHYGSEVLREMILAKKPKACVCGHIHAKDHSPVKLGETLVMNVSRIHESRRKAEFPPRVFTIKKVDGVTEVHVKEGVM